MRRWIVLVSLSAFSFVFWRLASLDRSGRLPRYAVRLVLGVAVFSLIWSLVGENFKTMVSWNVREVRNFDATTVRHVSYGFQLNIARCSALVRLRP
jgi:hypothetical protein